ncbi:MAG: hypothetical protein AB7M05_17435 [Alphaproteobacteria bacterium]
MSDDELLLRCDYSARQVVARTYLPLNFDVAKAFDRGKSLVVTLASCARRDRRSLADAMSNAYSLYAAIARSSRTSHQAATRIRGESLGQGPAPDIISALVTSDPDKIDVLVEVMQLAALHKLSPEELRSGIIKGTFARSRLNEVALPAGT